MVNQFLKKNDGLGTVYEWNITWTKNLDKTSAK